ncbi:MAG: hypothetical protein REI11_09975 [Patulibacter sp.]|nr:hypothetical protein [Patulibacter sp.]
MGSIQTTIFEGDQVAAICDPVRAWIAPWVLARPHADELRRRVAWRCMVAGAIARGDVPGPYSDALADAAAAVLKHKRPDPRTEAPAAR